MSLSFGRHHLAIPGPSVVPDRVLNAMHRPAPNIYAGELIQLVDELSQGLLKIPRCDGHAVIYHGNGHAAWEASLCNTHSRGDKALVLLTGRFGRGWMDMAEALGIETQSLDFGGHSPVAVDQLADLLHRDTSHSIKSLLTVQTDTASSVRNDIAAIRRTLDASSHPALLMVDCIASLGCEPFEMAAWGVDVTVAACQKGLMTPPGLAFTFINERALEAASHADLNSAYWDWQRRVNGGYFHQKFCGTPPTHHLFGIAEALKMINEEGLEHVWQRHEVVAKSIWAAVDAWSEGQVLACHVPIAEHRSTAVTTIRVSNDRADAIRNWCESNAGLTLGVGLELESVVGGQTSSLFRIGHMGHLNPPMVLGTLATIDSSLKALNIAHGGGAVEAASCVFANHLPER